MLFRSTIYKLQADIIEPYYQEVLAEFRQEYNPPELYMKEDCEERTSVINNLKADLELVKSIEESSKVDTNSVICLNCGKVHTEMYDCKCGNPVLVTRETALSVLEELNTLELTESQELEEDITDEGAINSIIAGDDSVATFGKYVSDDQLNMILKKEPEKIYVSLDTDAREQAEKLCSRIVELTSSEVYLVELPEGKDASDLGRAQYQYYLNTAKRYKTSSIYFLENFISSLGGN